MATVAPEQCSICGTFYLPAQREDHMNLHADPSSLAPKTSPNDLRKVELAKALHQQEEQDSTDIALRSLLPDEIPQGEDQRRNVGAPGDNNDYGGDSGSGAGPKKIDGSALRHMGNRDRLDLTSKLAQTSLSKDQFNKLEIEKQVDLKPIKRNVPKKEIHKYQNEPYSNKQIKDLGGCQKKVNPIKEEPRNVGNPNESGYKVSSDNGRNSGGNRGEAIFVPINRKTVDPKDYNQVDTKVNESKDRRRPMNEDPYEERTKKREDPYSSDVKPYTPVERTHNHNLHDHECPDCHGFYCRTCGATIPPQYRPFWDEDESPQMVQFYKKRIRQERQRERRQRGDCKTCLSSINEAKQERQKAKS